MAFEGNPNWLEWNSRSIPPRHRYEAWREMLNKSHLSWALDGEGHRDFGARLEAGRLAELQVTRCICDPCRGLRRVREISGDRDAYYGLLLIMEGREEVICRGGNALLGPGDFLLWDSTAPVRFRLHSPVHKITLFVKQDRMRDTLPQVDGLVGKTIDWKRGFGAVAASHISALASQIAYMDGAKARPMVENTLELIATCLQNLQPGMSGPAQADLLARIRDFIENNLDDPALDPHNLAKKFGISVRYLHLLFKADQITVSRWILQRRLEHCRRDLIRTGDRKNVTEVAYRWGFNDSAHFSRVFKKYFGIPPRDFRKRQ